MQSLFRHLLYDRYYRNRITQYIDLLSLSNVSLFVMDEKCHGYYIHGRSVHTTADTNMEELNDFLRSEANDVVPRRGLGDSNQQAFEVFVTLEWRKLFDKNRISSHVQGDIARTTGMQHRLTLSSFIFTQMK